MSLSSVPALRRSILLRRRASPGWQAADAVGKASLLLGAAGLASLALRRASAVRPAPGLDARAGRRARRAGPVARAAALAACRSSRFRRLADVDASRHPHTPPPASRHAAPRPALHRTPFDLSADRSLDRFGRNQHNAGPIVSLACSTRALGDAGAGVWFAGFVTIMARLLVGMIAVQWMSRRTEVVIDAPWLPLARRLAADLGVSPRVTFLRSPRATMPMAWGICRPAVLMPADADEWPVERLRIVLLHELAHVKRRDCLTHLLAQASCAVYWFNPLAWMAARHARAERERACDDLVLAAGTRGSDYAEELLEIARVMRAGRFPAVLAGATLAMAHRSQLEGRLLAILDPRIPRRGLTRLRALATSAACMLAIMPLAALQPWTNEAPVQQVNAAVPDVSIAPSAERSADRDGSSSRARRPAHMRTARRRHGPAQAVDQSRETADDRQGVAGGVAGGVSGGVASGVARDRWRRRQAAARSRRMAGGAAAGVADSVAGSVRTRLIARERRPQAAGMQVADTDANAQRPITEPIRNRATVEGRPAPIRARSRR